MKQTKHPIGNKPRGPNPRESKPGRPPVSNLNRPALSPKGPRPDPVDEASMDSFPCSDPPGFGHA
jgi:hypothetical protein